MFARKSITAAALVGALSMAGCANDGGLSLTTGSLNGETTATTAAAQKPALNQACVGLIAKIDNLRSEGTPERIKKVAAGKTETAVVKRSALAKVSELDQANSEYLAKCSTYSTAELRAAAKAQKLTPVTKTPVTKKTSTAKPAPTTTPKKTSAATTSPVKTTPVKTTAVPNKKTTTASTQPAQATQSATTAVKKTVAATPTITPKPATQPTIVNKTVAAVKTSPPPATSTMQKKTAAAVTTATTVPTAASTSLTKSTTEAAKKLEGAATTTTAAATTSAKKAADAAVAAAEKKAEETADKTPTFPPLGTPSAFATVGGNSVVVTTSP